MGENKDVAMSYAENGAFDMIEMVYVRMDSDGKSKEHVDEKAPLEGAQGIPGSKDEYSQKGECLMDIRQVQVGERDMYWKPRGLAVCPSTSDVIVTSDTSPNVYVLDSEFNYVNCFGSEGSGDGEFKNPRGVAVDPEENIIVCDWNNGRLQKLSKSGEAMQVITWPGQMGRPCDVTLDVDGNMYVADWDKHRILVFDACGQPLHTLGSPGKNAGQFDGLCSVTITGQHLAVGECHYGKGRLQLLDKSGTSVYSLRGGEGTLGLPRGVCTDRWGHVLMMDTRYGWVVVYTAQGEFMCRINIQKYLHDEWPFLPISFISVTAEGMILVSNSKTDSLLVY